MKEAIKYLKTLSSLLKILFSPFIKQCYGIV